MNKSGSEPRPLTVISLISHRQWALLESLLTSKPVSAILIDDPSVPDSVGADLVMHFALRFQAPINIVSHLTRMYPQSLSSCDDSGRYPIHVAAKWSLTPDVVAYLIKTNPTVVGIPDATGRTPMHYVGKYYIKHFPINDQDICDDSMLQVVRLLKKAAPHSMNLEDNEDMNAIEYALDSNAHIKVIKTMQRACRDDWRDRSKGVDGPVDEGDDIGNSQKSQGRKKHEELVKDMQNMIIKLQEDHSNTMLIGKQKLENGRVHVHRSGTLRANTRAARMA